MNSKVWMIRKDGKVIPVKIHPYGSFDSYEETVYAAEWLYKNTADDKVKADCEKFISLFSGGDKKYLEDYCKSLPYKLLTEEFIDSLSLPQNSADEKLDYYNEKIIRELDNEFLRVREGSMFADYGSQSCTGEMYFRISSEGFNWFPIMWEFVFKNKMRYKIENITVTRDTETTGDDEYYYRYKNEIMNHYPVDDFITIEGTPDFS